MRLFRLWHPTRCIGRPEQPVHIALEGSKSISNRALIVNALRGADPAEGLQGLSSASDTRTLLRLLRERPEVCDAGDGGTTLRFLAAYLALQRGCYTLTGTARMQERPVAPLVEGIRQLGAEVHYLKREGYPPLRICGLDRHALRQRPLLHLPANVSSQFISALLLVGPCLPNGLEVTLLNRPASEPYLRMTVLLMRHFGATVHRRAESHFVVEPGGYMARPLRIESDWTAAAYWYAIAALTKDAHVELSSLYPNSWQGDAIVTQLALPFGVRSAFSTEDGAPVVRLSLKRPASVALPGAVSFEGCPDLAQTFAVLYAAFGQEASFSGLDTLKIKETDRCAALQTELAKVGALFEAEPSLGATYRLSGRARWSSPPRFATYGDHRMAMAFAPLALLGPIEIENPDVVDKSYPTFWEHLRQAGFIIETLSA